LDELSEAEVSAGVLAALLLLPPTPAAGVVPRLRLTGARITGRLRLPHAEVRTPIALVDCRFDEPVDLGDAVLRAVDFSGCQMPELHADGLRTDGDLTLVRLASGTVSLFRAQIGGNLWLNAARIHSGETGFAIHGAQLRIDGGLYADSIHVLGTVNLWGAQAFSVEFTGAHLSGTPLALRGDGLRVTQDLQCSNLVTGGGIRLFAASIGGQFWLNNAEVHSTVDWAINAPTAIITGGVYARGLTAHGGLNLFAAVVGESIELRAAALRSCHRPALRAPGIRLGGDLLLDEAARLAGDVDLTRAEVGGSLTMAGATLDNDTTISLRHASIGVLDMTALCPPPAAVDLHAASIATIRDEPRTWPQRFTFDMLTYQDLDPVLPAAERLAWLARGSDGYHPQPFEHLAAHYRQLGHDRDARAVLVAHHRLRRRALRPLGRVWGYIEDVAVGYGYLPARALGWLLVPRPGS
jgi:hypothetical protein